MIGKEQFASMKKSAFLVNTSRRAVIDEEALVDSLMKGDIRGAGQDVFETELLPRNSPLLKLENVVMTPHITSAIDEAVEKTYRSGVENVVRYPKGLDKET